MKRSTGIYTFLLAVILLLGACTLEAIEEVGDECPSEDRDTSVLSYIVLPGGKYCHIDSVEPE